MNPRLLIRTMRKPAPVRAFRPQTYTLLAVLVAVALGWAFAPAITLTIALLALVGSGVLILAHRMDPHAMSCCLIALAIGCAMGVGLLVEAAK